MAKSVKYKGYELFPKKMNSILFGVLAFKNKKPVMVSSGHQQYIGVGRSKTAAIEDAKKSIRMFNRK